MNSRLALVILAALVLVPPAAFLWNREVERWRSAAAADRALADGEQALARHDPVRALVAFQRARELQPARADLQAAVWRARAALVAAEPERLGADAVEEVRYEVERLVEDGSGGATALTALSHLLRRKGDAAGADARLAEALKLEPAHAAALLARAQLLQRTSQNADEVIAAYEAAVKADPSSFPAHLQLGRLYGLKRDTPRQLDALKKATALRDDAGAWKALGDAFLGAGQLQESFDAYQRALALDPSAAEPRWRAGMILLQAERWALAEEQLRLAAQGGRFPELGFQLGLALSRQGKCGDAIPLYGQALQENPQHEPALLELASCAAAVGQPDAAAERYRQLLALPLPPEGDPLRAASEQRRKSAESALAQLGSARGAKKR